MECIESVDYEVSSIIGVVSILNWYVKTSCLKKNSILIIQFLFVVNIIINIQCSIDNAETYELISN